MQVKLKIASHSLSKYILEKVCKLRAFRSSLIPGMNQSLIIDLTVDLEFAILGPAATRVWNKAFVSRTTMGDERFE